MSHAIAVQATGFGGSAILFIGVVVILLAGAFGVLLIWRRGRTPKKILPAGAEVIPTRAQGTAPHTWHSSTKAEPRGPEPAPMPTPQRPSKERRSLFGKSERNERPATIAKTPDPQLTEPVLLEAAWQQSVYHGAKSIGGARVAVRIATARGRSHAYEGKAGQDVAGMAWNEDRRSFFAVVADGLGSRTDSGKVARILVEETLDRAEQLRGEDDPTKMIDRVFDAVEFTVERKGLNGATTVVLAEIRPGPEDVLVTTWGVGDSEAWLMHNGDWQALHHERRTDGQNVTRHVPGHREIHSEWRRVRYGSVVTLASDGFAGALGNSSELARRLADGWRKPPLPMDFLQQVNFDDPYFNDDRAAVVVWIR